MRIVCLNTACQSRNECKLFMTSEPKLPVRFMNFKVDTSTNRCDYFLKLGERK